MPHELDLTFRPYLAMGALWNGVPAGVDSNQRPVTSWQWAPAVWLVVDGSLDHINQLTAAGWERVGRWPPEDNDVTVVQLWGQLADIRLMQMPGQGDKDVWARSADVARVRAQPVTLAFTVSEEMWAKASAPTPDALGKVIHSAQAVPPPQFGELGIVVTRQGDQMTGGAYELSDLGEEGLEIWQRMGAALETLASLAEQRDPPAWLDRWQEVRQMAADLAALYWAKHQASQELQGATRRRRGPRQPQPGIVAKDPVSISLPSHIFAQNIMRGLLSGDDYQQYEDRQMAELRRNLAKGKGQMAITIQPGDGEEWEHVLNSLNRLGDEVVDTFCAILALAIDTHGVEHITAPMWVSTDDILRICQRKQSNRAYTPEQRVAVVEHERIIARAHVHASWPSGRKGREYRIDSAIWDVFGQAIGEYKTITGEPVWERRQVKIGEWAKLLPPLDKQTAVMLRTVLGYHSQRERYAKRLGRYLTLQFRVNWNRNGGIVERKMATLLEQAGIKPDVKRPGETRTTIEGALDRLRQDGVLGAYSLVVDATPAAQGTQALVEERARGWWDIYAQQLWRFEPPTYARTQYRQIPARARANDEGE